jgi:uncharacterized membrane protein
MQTLAAATTAFVAFTMLDGLWLGVVMKGFYRTQLAPIGRMADGGFAPIWPAAVVVYMLLALGIAVFVVPRATDAGSAAVLGAVFGLVVYGVYDLTNYSTLAAWPAAVTMADIAWGTGSCSLAAAVTWWVTGR